jgi:hypothetical protein
MGHLQPGGQVAEVRIRGAILAAVGLLWTASASAGAAPTPGKHRCDVVLNVTDQDPGGLNVRGAPSLEANAVIGVLKARGKWVQVHVVSQLGDWVYIDGATLYDDDLADGEARLPGGKGWVRTSKLGFEAFNVGAVIRAAPDERSARMISYGAEGDDTPHAQVIGCSGQYIQVRIGRFRGWTNAFCSNQRTTCS